MLSCCSVNTRARVRFGVRRADQDSVAMHDPHRQPAISETSVCTLDDDKDIRCLKMRPWYRVVISHARRVGELQDG